MEITLGGVACFAHPGGTNIKEIYPSGIFPSPRNGPLRGPGSYVNTKKDLVSEGMDIRFHGGCLVAQVI